MGKQTHYKKVHWYIFLSTSKRNGCYFSIFFRSTNDENVSRTAGIMKLYPKEDKSDNTFVANEGRSLCQIPSDSR